MSEPLNPNRTPEAPSTRQVQILISGMRPTSADFLEGETDDQFIARMATEGIPTNRVETFFVNGVPVSGGYALQHGDVLVGTLKTEGGC